jgi:phenylalanyl-tRNA synthetase beta chain
VLRPSSSEREQVPARFQYPQTFRPGAEKRVDQRGVFEAQTLTFLMAGRDLVEPSAELWNKDARPLDFFDLKGKLETLLQSTKVKVEWRAPKTPISFLHPAQQAELVLYRDVVGWAGAVHPDILRAFDIRTDEAWVAEILVEPILAQIPKVRFKFDFPSPYQRVERDAAFIVDRRVTAAQAVESLRKVKLETLKDAYIFDVYEGQGIESGKKSIALRFVFQSHERTLTEEEINQAFHQCIDSIRQQCQAELRGSV